MANRRANLTWRDGDGYYHAVEYTNTGRIRNTGIDGVFYLSWREGKRQRRLSVGRDVNEALTQLKRKEAELDARAEGVAVVAQAQENHHSLAQAIADYLGDVELVKKPATLDAYTHSLTYFAEFCTKQNLADIERRDLLQFVAFLRDTKNLSPRTVHNRFLHTMSFLKRCGIRVREWTPPFTKDDWPQFTEETPEIFESDELAAIFGACEQEEREWFEFFLMTGMREQEAMHAGFSDVNFGKGTITVRWKPEWGFAPKKYKERHIPVPDKLVASLKARKAKRGDKKCDLIFPTLHCRPKDDFLRCLKIVAERAGLDRDTVWLHKFRSTFATTHLRNGVDLRTVQAWMGHKDIQSTMRYLRPAEGEAVRAKVNTAFA